jgi:limonene-1,2-epoxide hydrolase
MTAGDCFARYLHLFETLTADRLDEFDPLTTPDVRFSDPFTDVIGRDRLKAVLAKMFADVDEPRFTVIGYAGDGASRYVRWRFDARSRGRTRVAIAIEGMSEMQIAEDGRICSHVDHWDAARQVYERLPVLGWLLRQLKRRIGISH